jgi:hypothetical protein
LEAASCAERNGKKDVQIKIKRNIFLIFFVLYVKPFLSGEGLG